MVRDYTRASSSGSTPKGDSAKPKGPDAVVHHPPIVLFALGGFGFLAGVLTNLWQIGTTFFALWVMFNVGTGTDKLNVQTFWQKQPVIAGCCLLISTCAQYFLQMLVFKIDKQWKVERAEGKKSGAAMVGAAVNIVQQVDVITAISFLAFVICTISDYTFITMYTPNIFLIFAYAISLYAFSTVGFVRGIEYIWAAMAALYGGKGKSHA